MNLKVCIEEGEDGYFVASVPALKGFGLRAGRVMKR